MSKQLTFQQTPYVVGKMCKLRFKKYTNPGLKFCRLCFYQRARGQACCHWSILTN